MTIEQDRNNLLCALQAILELCKATEDKTFPLDAIYHTAAGALGGKEVSQIREMSVTDWCI